MDKVVDQNAYRSLKHFELAVIQSDNDDCKLVRLQGKRGCRAQILRVFLQLFKKSFFSELDSLK